MEKITRKQKHSLGLHIHVTKSNVEQIAVEDAHARKPRMRPLTLLNPRIQPRIATILGKNLLKPIHDVYGIFDR